ncbi:MAG: cation-translocating P-type ATPase [Taibaiella sp.]|nr:cation-translocating P-type ATPase [Taibaiella sp.]
MQHGISSEEAAAKLQQYGYNELPSAKPRNFWGIAKEVMREPMFLLLIGCGFLYMAIGDYREGAVLMSTILLIVGITFYQYRKTEKALNALRQLSSPRALVIRDGVEMRLAARELVPDDILVLNEGDRIPADARLIETMNLQVDESMLTGESMPVSKYPGSENDLLFGGTLVVQGRCIAKTTETGMRSKLGKIAATLEGSGDGTTRLQREMKVMITRFAVAGIMVSAIVVVAYYLTRGDLLKSILLGLASSMAILPEEFPVVLTVFLALGAWRLSRTNVLTRKPTAIETLGSATVLCSDKTGTITQNKMEVAALSTKDGYSTDISGLNIPACNLLRIAWLASQRETIDPMDAAINKLAGTLNLSEGNEKLVREYALSRELMAVTRVYENRDGGLIVAAKGAPEAIFQLCRLTKEEIADQEKHLEKMAEAGLRLLGVATLAANVGDIAETPAGMKFAFSGLLAFEDPIRPEVPQAIQSCRDAGLKVIMITGDHPVTARTIGLKAGMGVNVVITGDELSRLTDEQLSERIRENCIFARILPEYKLRIVKVLKLNGEVVAMTGDGVNDAPALKAADIGIAMGFKGTDVAREAASLVLLDDNFASIVVAIRLGRRIFDNMQKAMSYIIAIHVPIAGLTLLPAFVPSLPILLLPLHIVFMELIVDPVCSVAFESEQEEVNIMNRPPRAVDQKFFSVRRMLYSFFQGLLLLLVVLGVYFFSIREGHSEGEIRAIAFSSLIVGNIFLILSNLSNTRPFTSVFKERNVAVIIILLVAILLLIAIISVPQLRYLFSFSYPGYTHFAVSALGALGLLLVLEVIKYARKEM